MNINQVLHCFAVDSSILLAFKNMPSCLMKKYLLCLCFTFLTFNTCNAFGYTNYTGPNPNQFQKCIMTWDMLSSRLQNTENEIGQGLSDPDASKIAFIGYTDAKKGINNPNKVDSIGKSPIISELQYLLYNEPFIGNTSEVNNACIQRINEVANDPYNTQNYN